MAVVTMVAYDFTPRNWLQCNGQLLSIASNSALFSLLGTTYGGNGVQTFGIPDMRGRVPVSMGVSSTGTTYTLGEVSGTESTSLTINNLPAHTHNGNITITPRVGSTADQAEPDGAFPGQLTNGYAQPASANTFLQGPEVVSTTIGVTGSGYPMPLITPYNTVNYVICTMGIYPSRN
jgi:microcystin-dependent protein